MAAKLLLWVVEFETSDRWHTEPQINSGYPLTKTIVPTMHKDSRLAIAKSTNHDQCIRLRWYTCYLGQNNVKCRASQVYIWKQHTLWTQAWPGSILLFLYRLAFLFVWCVFRFVCTFCSTWCQRWKLVLKVRWFVPHYLFHGFSHGHTAPWLYSTCYRCN